MTAHFAHSATFTTSSTPNYALRRTVAAVILAVVVFIAATMSIAAVEALADPGGRPAAASEIGRAPVATAYVAEAGDSLWSIAEAHRGDVAAGAYVDALIDLNGGTDIQVGPAVRLP
jgi:hypothetical protein